MDILLAVDLGSSSLRCIPFDSSLNVVSAISQVPVHMSDDGSFDANFLAENMVSVITDCLESLRQTFANKTFRIVGVAASSLVMAMVAVSSDGSCTMLTYACTQSQTYADQLRERFSPEYRELLYQRTGVPIHGAYLPSQLLRLLCINHSTIVYVTSLYSFMLSRWMDQQGKKVPISFSEASWTGLLNRHSLTWDTELCDHLNVDVTLLPPLSDFSNPVSGLSASYAAMWPELKSCPFFLAIGDGAAANIGSGCWDTSQICVTIGTSAAARVVVNVDDGQCPRVPDGLWSYCIDRKRHVIGGALTDGGRLYEFMTNLLKPSSEDLDAVNNLEPDSHGLTLLPFLGGERSPGWALHAHCVLAGITYATTTPQILKASMEAVSLRLAEIVSRLQHLVDANAPLVATGGALKQSKIWGSITANACGRSLLIVNVEEASARGVAMLGWEALSNKHGLTFPLPTVNHTVCPSTDAIEKYNTARKRLQSLYDKIFY